MANFDIFLTLKQGDQLFADIRRISLLKAISQTGSLSQAAKLIGISYKTAWDAIHDLNQLADTPFVNASTGGKGGGGAELSSYAKRFIALYDSLTEIQRHAFDLLDDERVPVDDLLTVASTLSLQSSARNQLYGTVSAIKVNDVAGHVLVLLQDKKTELIAYITHSSIERLNLSVGKKVLLMIKAPQIDIIHSEAAHQNAYQTMVEKIIPSDQWVELVLRVSSTVMLYASRPIGELTELNIKQGQKISVSIHPENIIIATMC